MYIVTAFQKIQIFFRQMFTAEVLPYGKKKNHVHMTP